MKEGINVCKYVCMYRTERNGKTLWLLIKNQFLSICIQMINTHGDTIYMFLWVEEERQFLWNCTAKTNWFILTTEWLPWLQSSCGYESFTLHNWIRQPEEQVLNV